MKGEQIACWPLPARQTPERAIYLDHHATTPIDPRVAKVVLEAMLSFVGNANSTEHAFGEDAAQLIEFARCAVGQLLGAAPSDVHFTSGSTEAIHLAVAHAAARCGRPMRIALPRTEHWAVINAVTRLQHDLGGDIRWLRVDNAGRIDLEALRRDLKAVDLLCLMAANNEVGTIHPIAEASVIAHDCGASVLVDGTQAAGRIDLRSEEWGLDYLVASSHKIYGPKGAGALIGPDVNADLDDHIFPHGGTPNVPAIAGFGAACRLMRDEGRADEVRIAGLRDRLEAALAAMIPGLKINGARDARLSHNLHVSVPGVPNGAVVARVYHQIGLSTGSACRSGAQAPSHVLTAMGLPNELRESALRMSPGRFTTMEEIDRAASVLARAVEDVRASLRRVAC